MMLSQKHPKWVEYPLVAQRIRLALWHLQGQELANFFCQVTSLPAYGHMVSIATPPLRSHRQYVNEWAHLCSEKTLFVDTEV